MDNRWSRSRWQVRNASIVSRTFARRFSIPSRAVCQQDICMMGRNAPRDALSCVFVSLLEVCENTVVQSGLVAIVAITSGASWKHSSGRSLKCPHIKWCRLQRMTLCFYTRLRTRWVREPSGVDGTIQSQWYKLDAGSRSSGGHHHQLIINQLATQSTQAKVRVTTDGSDSSPNRRGV